MGKFPQDAAALQPRSPGPISPEFADGWDAWKQGVLREACPYVREEHVQDWRAGWDTAEREMGDAP